MLRIVRQLKRSDGDRINIHLSFLRSHGFPQLSIAPYPPINALESFTVRIVANEDILAMT
jgi:hypothetical protein